MATLLVIYVIYAQVVSQDYSYLIRSMEGRAVYVGEGMECWQGVRERLKGRKMVIKMEGGKYAWRGKYGK